MQEPHHHPHGSFGIAHPVEQHALQPTHTLVNQHCAPLPVDEASPLSMPPQQLIDVLMQNTDDALVIAEVDPQTSLGARICYTNQAFTRITGYTAAEVRGHSPHILRHANADRVIQTQIQLALTAAEPVHLELLSQTKDGRPYWSELQFVPLHNTDGVVTHILSILRDVTSRKLSAIHEHDRRQIVERITRNDNPEQTLSAIIALLEHQQPDMDATIMLCRRGHLGYGAASRLPAEFAAAFDALTDELCRQPGTFGEPLLVPSPAAPAAWPAYTDLAASFGLQSCWTVAIQSASHELLGLVILSAGTSRTATPADLKLLADAASLAALAIERHHLSEQLTRQAQYDVLTGLPNRYLLDERLHQALSCARRENRHVGLLFIDLDNFKHINDCLGHPVGDMLLVQVARRFEYFVRTRDTLARWGGDEFTLVLPHLTDAGQAARVAERLLETLNAPFVIKERELFVTASIGISVFPDNGDDVTTLLSHADSALFRAKESGRNSFACFAPKMIDSASRHLDLEHPLRAALRNGELTLYYQPIIDMVQRRVSGVEALLRWHHPERGMIPPGDFIPLAEQSGLIIPLGAWVLTESCRQAAAWQRAGLPTLCVSVNVSALQFARDDFVHQVIDALAQSGLSPALLELEVTERMVMQELDSVAERLQQLRALGVRVLIDDFGTGYSSLAYLRQLMVDGLKIDRSFINDMTAERYDNTDPLAVVSAIVSLAHAVNLSVIAEGVETAEQYQLLCDLTCDEMQGFFFAYPQPVETTWDTIFRINALLAATA